MYKLPAIYSLLLAFVTCPLLSQTLGVGGGYDYGPATLELSMYRGVPYKQSFSGNTGSVIIFAEGTIPISSAIMGSARLSWSSTTPQFRRPFPQPEVMIPGGLPPFVILPVAEMITCTTTAFEVESTVRWLVSKRFWLAGGPIIGYRFTSGYRHDVYYDQEGLRISGGEYPNYTYEQVTHGSIVSMEDGYPVEQRNIAIGALLSIGTDFPVSSIMSLVPELRIRSDLYSPVEGIEWNRIAIGGVLSLQIYL